MIKQTLYFGNPAYLSKDKNQLSIKLPNTDERIEAFTRPIEDIGVVILDNPQITITQALISALLANNVALITCNEIHHPVGLLLNLVGHTRQTLHFKKQIEAGEALKKRLWQQTIKAKVLHQAVVLRQRNMDSEPLLYWEKEVKSGDSENTEAKASIFYWKNVFSGYFTNFKRNPDGEAPNHLLNYGYAILRAIVARAIVGSGLHPSIGLFHRNQYNPYTLADDLMEPYRPFVDKLVINIIEQGLDYNVLDKSIKSEILQIGQVSVSINGDISPLMVAVSRTTASLVKCFEGKTNKVLYPDF